MYYNYYPYNLPYCILTITKAHRSHVLKARIIKNEQYIISENNLLKIITIVYTAFKNNYIRLLSVKIRVLLSDSTRKTDVFYNNNILCSLYF